MSRIELTNVTKRWGQFYAVDNLSMETNYVILLAHDVYDVPYRGKDGGGLDDASENQYSYIVCSICPVKMTKTNLRYDAQEQAFHLQKPDFVAAAPGTGSPGGRTPESCGCRRTGSTDSLGGTAAAIGAVLRGGKLNGIQ